MTELKFHAPGEEPFAGYDVQLRSACTFQAHRLVAHQAASLTGALSTDCRCGGSANKPCRGGSHRRIDFRAVPEEVEALR
jgi:CDGSH-type Zn-finger protein